MRRWEDGGIGAVMEGKEQRGGENWSGGLLRRLVGEGSYSGRVGWGGGWGGEGGVERGLKETKGGRTGGVIGWGWEGGGGSVGTREREGEKAGCGGREEE